MTIVEQLARFLADRLRLPFEGSDPGGAVFFGYLPERPVKAVCAYAGDLRSGEDAGGARVQIAIRSDEDGAWPLNMAARIAGLLDGQRDVIFTEDGDYVHRIGIERGFEFSGVEGGGSQYYTADFRIYWCGREGG